MLRTWLRTVSMLTSSSTAVSTEYRVQHVGEESIRELVEIRARFTGLSPLGQDETIPPLSPIMATWHTVPIVVVQNGQVVADLTDGTAVSAARPGYDLTTKSWQLELEIAGLVIPSDVHVPLFAQTAAARLTAITIGSRLEQIAAVHTQSEAKF